MSCDCPLGTLLLRNCQVAMAVPTLVLDMAGQSSQAPSKTRVLLVFGKCPASVRDVVHNLSKFVLKYYSMWIDPSNEYALCLQNINEPGWTTKHLRLKVVPNRFIVFTAHVVDCVQLLFS